MENLHIIVAVLVIIILLWYLGWLPWSGFSVGSASSSYYLPTQYLAAPQLAGLSAEFAGVKDTFNGNANGLLANYVYYRDYGWLIDHANGIVDPQLKINMRNVIGSLITVERRMRDMRFGSAAEKQKYYLDQLTKEVNIYYNPPVGSTPLFANNPYRTELDNAGGFTRKLLQTVRTVRNLQSDADFLAYIPSDSSVTLAQNRLNNASNP